MLWPKTANALGQNLTLRILVCGKLDSIPESREFSSAIFDESIFVAAAEAKPGLLACRSNALPHSEQNCGEFAASAPHLPQYISRSPS